MIRAERHEMLVKLVDQREIMTVEEITAVTGASRATIRRDIDQLDREGLVKKTRGGAMTVRRTAVAEPSLRLRSSTNTDEKIRMAQLALSIVGMRERILLDSGTTVLELARRLPKNSQLTVLTNDLFIATELAPRRDVDVVMLGGSLRSSYYYCVGYYGERMLKEIKVNRAFISADAVDLELGAMSFTAQELPIKKLMIQSADQIILMCDHSKFETQAFLQVATLEEIDIIITGKELREDIHNKLLDMGVDVRLA